MGWLGQGTNLSYLATFNAGTLDINGLEIATLQDINIDLNVTVKELRQLGSIKMVTPPKRVGYKPTAKGKVATVNKELMGAFLGSSAADSTVPGGNGFDFTLLDGQNVLSRANINVLLNDNTAFLVQFQFINAIIGGSFALALKAEDFGMFDVEIMAQDCIVITNF